MTTHDDYLVTETAATSAESARPPGATPSRGGVKKGRDLYHRRLPKQDAGSLDSGRDLYAKRHKKENHR